MINTLLPIVERAAEKMSGYYHSDDKQISYKGENDPVTQYDLAIEKQLTEAFHKAFPDFTIVGEESSSANAGLLPGKVIYIDPIDGTVNFTHRFAFTAISVGVFVDKQPYCGVVAAPVLGEIYTASKGKGAYLNGKRIYVSDIRQINKSMVATGFPYSKQERQAVLPLFEHILGISQGIRRTGSAALDLCYVAKGSFDMYYESTLKAWDVAAGILMVQEAGGVVTDAQGNAHDLGEQIFLATNGHLHDLYLREIQSVMYGKG